VLITDLFEWYDIWEIYNSASDHQNGTPCPCKYAMSLLWKLIEMENGVKSSRQLLTRLGTKNSSLMSQSFERRTFSDAAVKFRKSRSSNVVNRKDGHRVSFRNVFWEERMRTVSKPPLWIEHLDATSQVLVGKRSSKKTHFNWKEDCCHVTRYNDSCSCFLQNSIWW